MRRAALLAFSLTLAACAPAPTSGPATAPTASPPSITAAQAQSFRAVFSDYGVAWVSEGRACVARAPSYQPICPRLAPVSDVAWQGDTAWALLPQQGLVVTLDLAPRSVTVGAGAALSSLGVYRQDGSFVSYGGELGRGVSGAPSAAVTGGDGRDYVLLGSELRRVADGAVTERSAGPFLYIVNTGAASALVPTVTDGLNTYRVSTAGLERVSGSGVSRIPHELARIGLVRGELVTVTSAGNLRRFTANLRSLN